MVNDALDLVLPVTHMFLLFLRRLDQLSAHVDIDVCIVIVYCISSCGVLVEVAFRYIQWC